MRLSHILLAILMAALWGFSFVAMKEGLVDMPPLLLSAFRFLLTTFPAIFFLKKPDAPWRLIMSYGICMFALTFSLAFFSIEEGLTAGLASLLLQLQVFFTVLLAIVFLKEKINLYQIIGALVSLVGLIIIALDLKGVSTEIGLLLIVLAAFTGGLANIASKLAGKINMLGFVVWGSLFAWPPLFLLSFLIDGSEKIFFSVEQVSNTTIVCLFYMAYPATIFTFALWAWLLSKYPTALVSPFSLLVPFFGMLGSIIIFNEPLENWKIIAALLIVAGLCIGIFGSKCISFLKSRQFSFRSG